MTLNLSPSEYMHPIQTTSAAKATIDCLLALIREGRWKPGGRLPAQRELAKTLGIGMSTLREALQSLQSIGILEMRQGEGTFVTAQPYQTIEKILSLSLALNNLDVSSLFEARIFLEGGLAYYAAERASEEQIATIFQNLDEQEKAIDEGRIGDVDDLDLKYHRLIIEMANSKFLEQVEGMLHHELEQFLRSVPHTKEGVKFHRAVAEAIRARDPQGSSDAIRKLVESTAARYNAYVKKADQRASGNSTVPSEDGSKNQSIDKGLK